MAWEIERRGDHSFLADQVRAQFERRRETVMDSAAAPEDSKRMTPEEVRQQAVANWRALRLELGRGAPTQAREAPAAAPPWSLFGQSATDRQIESLRRELGRDDLGL